MSELISGKEAAVLYLNGENVLHLNKDMVETNNQWADCKGMNIDDAITRLEGIKCGFKNTSCPNELAKGIKEYYNK